MTKFVVTVESSPTINIQVPPEPSVKVILAGNVGPPGPQGQWVAMTQAEYDALILKDPETLYVIIE